jgi:hypothetical protein
MNQALRLSPAPDTAIAQWARIASTGTPATSGRGFTNDRLRAFATRFSPSRQSLLEKVSGPAITAAIYAGIAALAWELGTANLTPLFAALHLNGV